MALTEAGLALGPLIRQLGEWGLQSAHDPLEEGDLDVTVLTWNMRRRVDPTVFPERRITVYFEFTRRAEKQGTVVGWESVDLCPKDPGFPVDLYVTTDIRTMIDIWLGKRTWDAAVGSGRVDVVGPARVARPHQILAFTESDQSEERLSA